MGAKLCLNTHPAERQRGCRQADNFKSQALVEANNGTVTDVSFANQTATFNGSSSSIEYEAVQLKDVTVMIGID